jgi:hypothetical protein
VTLKRSRGGTSKIEVKKQIRRFEKQLKSEK